MRSEKVQKALSESTNDQLFNFFSLTIFELQ